MDILSNLKYAEGSRKKRKRVGRGQGSGHGGTSTRGHKGQRSRSGAKFRAWFEGGQMPLQRRVPKFGFKNINRVEYSVMNLDDIQKLIDDKKILETTIDKEYLLKNKFLKGKNKPLKILGNGEITTKLDITADAFSKTAIEKIEKAGGKAVKL
ncbi:MAG TPA: 50S ribosomal protein L15 [Ignavibacteria bacterium]|nr:50S ribosomal protein L15 [Ignavibacteria bacterium]HQY52916.1 50S ribosomal protein L15 [Ignavibacteria bacterium]HRB00336.1 50S ribosomal protein L15 [Ignavibacteria bacterium]